MPFELGLAVAWGATTLSRHQWFVFAAQSIAQRRFFGARTTPRTT
ncbi:MAG: hypothetical protein RMK57_02390 [Bryobacterales bacterium]|nr:hypothetical protein [Bryobacteraceae bacterium]MDW8353355.1 hypothetical protein [Bryobacterales bacterium]